MNKLEEIIAFKRKEIEQRKNLFSLNQLEKSLFYTTEIRSFVKLINKSLLPGIIAEFKRKSPSKGIINETADVVDVTAKYLEAGAVGISVLTDIQHFGGSFYDLIQVRKAHNCPVLRKDFIIDEYQVIESKSIGADMILLIAACLSANDIKTLYKVAHSLHLEVLVEVHGEEELEKCNGYFDLLGVNNRNLKTLEVDLATSYRLIKKISSDTIVISESGISRTEDIVELSRAGFKGFLIGENFMKTSDPGQTCKDFMAQLKQRF